MTLAAALRRSGVGPDTVDPTVVVTVDVDVPDDGVRVDPTDLNDLPGWQ